ncbi:Hypothetical predicted protein, partial [Cloeon dipterum]
MVPTQCHRVRPGAVGVGGGGARIYRLGVGVRRPARRAARYKVERAAEAQQFTTMYKTVRHGENSLQYTILPQQDSGPHGVDSEAAAAAAAFGGRKEATACGRSAVLVAICVVLVGGVVAAVIVPFLVSSSIVIRTPHHRPLRPASAAPTPPPAPELLA